LGPLHDYRGMVLYSTLMPSYMCAGALIQFGIRRVVVGEARNFTGARALLREHGVEVEDLDSPECRGLLGDFIRAHHDLWLEDIGAGA
jgi:cytosine/creatinine deaminase